MPSMKSGLQLHPDHQDSKSLYIDSWASGPDHIFIKCAVSHHITVNWRGVSEHPLSPVPHYINAIAEFAAGT